MQSKLIAPCGMNCALCIAYLREKNKCPGCRAIDKHMPVTRVRCKIKNCGVIKKNNWKFCSIKCKEFPCLRMKNLDKRYKTKYCMSMIDNLNKIEKKGIKEFLKMEEKKWIKGNKIFCVHNKKYYKI
jgi:hypothetical protein